MNLKRLATLVGGVLLSSLLLPTPVNATLQPLTGGGMYYGKVWGVGTLPALATVATFNDTGDKVALIFQVPKTGNISEIGWRTRTVTTGDIVDVRLETVDTADNNPSGTLCNSGTTNDSNKTVTVAGSDDDVWFNTALTHSCAVTLGDIRAIVLSAATFVSSGSMLIGGQAANALGDAGHFPYTRQAQTSGTWTTQGAASMTLALKYDDGNYYPLSMSAFPILPVTTYTSSNYQVGSATDEFGMKWQVPFTGALCGVDGFWDFPSASGTFELVVYDSTDTAITTLTLDTDQVNSNAAGSPRATEFIFANQTIAVNSTYRTTLRPTSANNVTLYDVTVNTAGMLAAMPGGANFVLTSRVNQTVSGWTDSTTRRPLMGLKFCSLDDGAGGGGGGSSVKRVIGS